MTTALPTYHAEKILLCADRVQRAQWAMREWAELAKTCPRIMTRMGLLPLSLQCQGSVNIRVRERAVDALVPRRGIGPSPECPAGEFQDVDHPLTTRNIVGASSPSHAIF